MNMFLDLFQMVFIVISSLLVIYISYEEWK